jgi:hypothetical protein
VTAAAALAVASLVVEVDSPLSARVDASEKIGCAGED